MIEYELGKGETVTYDIELDVEVNSKARLNSIGQNTKTFKELTEIESNLNDLISMLNKSQKKQ